MERCIGNGRMKMAVQHLQYISQCFSLDRLICKLRQQCNTTTQLLGWLKSKTTGSYQMLGRMPSSSIAIEMQGGTNTLKDSWVSRGLAQDPAMALLGIHPTELKTYPHKILHMGVYIQNSITHNCPKLEETKKSFNNKLRHIHNSEYQTVIKKRERDRPSSPSQCGSVGWSIVPVH